MKKHPHETTLLAIYDDPSQAYQAMDCMEKISLPKDDISLIASNEAYEKEELVELIAGDKLHTESIHAGKVGGIAGAVIAGITAITGFLTSGASLLATGPLIAFLSGAGGILGGVLGAGFTEEEAKTMDRAVAEGKILLIIHAENRHIAHEAKEILKQEGATQIRAHH